MWEHQCTAAHCGLGFFYWQLSVRGWNIHFLGRGFLGSRVLCWFDWLLVALFWSAARTGLWPSPQLPMTSSLLASRHPVRASLTAHSDNYILIITFGMETNSQKRNTRGQRSWGHLWILPTTILLFIYYAVDEHLGCFKFGAIMNKAALNMYLAFSGVSTCFFRICS